jgi:hypothetical protein
MSHLNNGFTVALTLGASPSIDLVEPWNTGLVIGDLSIVRTGTGTYLFQTGELDDGSRPSWTPIASLRSGPAIVAVRTEFAAGQIWIRTYDASFSIATLDASIYLWVPYLPPVT